LNHFKQILVKGTKEDKEPSEPENSKLIN